MPIDKEKRKLYPKNWEAISEDVRRKAEFCCELCDAENGKDHPITGAKVVLTVHHLDYNPTHNERINLIALCQRCHNRLDGRYRARNRRRKRERLSGQRSLLNRERGFERFVGDED